MNGRRTSQGLGIARAELREEGPWTLAAAIVRRGRAAAHPVKGEVPRYACPDGGGNPEAMY